MTGYILAGLAGLVTGSFLNVVITRLPREEPCWAGFSCCPYCHHPLPWHAFIPLVSLVRFLGRCRCCGSPLSWRHCAVDLAAGLLALALWARFPGSPLLWVYGPFTAALLVLTVLDLQYCWLPDLITLPGVAFGLAAALIFPHVDFRSALLGAVGGWALFHGVRWAYDKLTRGARLGLGGGDVKLLAFIGAVLGLGALPWVVFSSAVLGSLAGLAAVWRSGQIRVATIPYGPFLALGALSCLFWKT